MNIGSVIPQIFFDLIARISPGMVVILAGLYVWAGGSVKEQEIGRISDWLARENSPVTVIVFFALFAAYVLAFVLDGICGLLPFSFLKEAEDNRHVKEILKDFETLHPKLGEGYQFPGIALRYDAVRLKDANAGARLTKLRAELHMCRVLILGLSILAAVNLYNVILNFGWPTVLSEALLIVAVVSFKKTHDNLQSRFTWGSCNHWLLLVKPGILDACKSRAPQEPPKVTGPDAEQLTPVG